MTPLIVVLVVCFLFIGAITLIVIGLRYRSESDPLQQRLASLLHVVKQPPGKKSSFLRPSRSRHHSTGSEKVGEISLASTPQNALQATARKLDSPVTHVVLDSATFWAYA